MAKKPQVSAADQTSADQPDEQESLRQELEQYKQRAVAAENALRDEQAGRRRAELATMSEQEQRIVAQQESCESNLSALGGQADSLEAQIAQLADEPGHGAEIAKLNRQMSRVEGQILEETRRKNYLAEQRELAKTKRETPPAPTGRTLANGFPIERFSAATNAWLDKHPRAFTDRDYVEQLIVASGTAVKVKHLTPDTPEYFAFVEDLLGEAPVRRVAPQNDDGEELIPDADSPYSQPGPAAGDGEEIVTPTARNPQPRAAGSGSLAAAAPPSRSIPGNRPAPGSKRLPALTPEQRQVANELYASDPTCKTEADRLRKYQEGMTFMAGYSPQYFGGQAN